MLTVARCVVLLMCRPGLRVRQRRVGPARRQRQLSQTAQATAHSIHSLVDSSLLLCREWVVDTSDHHSPAMCKELKNATCTRVAAGLCSICCSLLIVLTAGEQHTLFLTDLGHVFACGEATVCVLVLCSCVDFCSQRGALGLERGKDFTFGVLFRSFCTSS